jgi:hypothetical protein
LAKPSTLWPVPTLPEKAGRIVPTVTNEPPKPGEADTLKPSPRRVEQTQHSEDNAYGPGKTVETQEEMLENSESSPESSLQKAAESDPEAAHKRAEEISDALKRHDLDHWEPNPPKVFMENANSRPLELRSQIQMYATTE